jgi:anti-sigma factor RsiW
MIGPHAIDLVCQELVELVTEYLGQTLLAPERVRFEKHLLTCPPCTAYLAQMKATLELTGELDQAPSPPAAVEQELLSLFRRWQSK